MEWYQWTSIAAIAVCLGLFACRAIRLIKAGTPKDLSDKSGEVGEAVAYSFTTAMLPKNKESAYLHPRTYLAGIIFHIGAFLSILMALWFLVSSFIGIELSHNTMLILAVVILLAALNGAAILIKRIKSRELRELSGFDDYFSNAIVTIVELLTALYILYPEAETLYYISATVMFLWLPIGKTKHLLYFFFARFHLGFFYGWRGTWPSKTI